MGHEVVRADRAAYVLLVLHEIYVTGTMNTLERAPVELKLDLENDTTQRTTRHSMTRHGTA